MFVDWSCRYLIFSQIPPSGFLQMPWRVGELLRCYVCPQVPKVIQIQLLRKVIFTMKQTNLEQRVCLSWRSWMMVNEFLSSFLFYYYFVFVWGGGGGGMGVDRWIGIYISGEQLFWIHPWQFQCFHLGGLEGIPALVSSLDPTNKDQLLRRGSAGPGDLLLFAVGQHASVNKTLDRLRVFVAHELGLVDHVSF